MVGGGGGKSRRLQRNISENGIFLWTVGEKLAESHTVLPDSTVGLVEVEDH